MNIKKLAIYTLLFLFGAVSQVQAGNTDLTGWAWSSNIGWVSFNCSNHSCAVPYKVTVSTTTGSSVGTLSGYAWSPNIGWIKFGPGDATHPTPTVDMVTGAVTGDIRACAGTVNKDCNSADRTDGWDGWAKLSDNSSPYYPTNRADGSGGLTYVPADGTFVGKGWGGMNIGWFSFLTNITASRVCVGVCGPSGKAPTVTIVANPGLVVPGGESLLSWTTGNNPTSCTASGSWSGSPEKSGGEELVKVSNPPQTYTITCTNSYGTSPPASVTIGPSSSPSALQMWLAPASGINGSRQAAVRVKEGQDVNINWEATGVTLGACEGYIDSVAVPGVATKQQNAYLTISGLAKGKYEYSMTCQNASNLSPIDALAPGGATYLQITVGDSKIIEI
jgi:hypothetical protein